MYVKSVFINLDIRQLDCQYAPFFPHGISGIGAKIHQKLMNMSCIRHHQRIALDFLAYGDGRRQRGPQKFNHLFSDELHLYRFAFPLGLTTECENLFDQILGPLTRLQYFLKALMAGRLRFGVDHGYFGITENG